MHTNSMTLAEFASRMGDGSGKVVLLEGKRDIPAPEAEAAHRTGELLARLFPKLIFRSGNAKGTDESFCGGVASVDPSRIQIILPYKEHRIRERHPSSYYASPQILTEIEEEQVAYKTSEASPGTARLVERRKQGGAIGGKIRYLIRDTMKVVGHGEALPAADFALFYVDPDDPMSGGTGHTIRVCQMEGIPFVFQDSWMTWADEV